MTVIVVWILPLAAMSRQQGPGPAPPPIFFDDFSSGQLDRSKWNVIVTGRTVNNEQQAYVDSSDTITVGSGPDTAGAENGALIIVEKVLGEESTLNRLFIQHYYEMKMRNGYSELEISQKREALENVLVPYRLEENKELLRGAGFRHVDVFFKWYNFCGLIALK